MSARLMHGRIAPVLAFVLGASLVAAGPARAQRLLDARIVSAGAVAESWNFGSIGLFGVQKVQELTLPVTVVVPVTHRFSFDAYGAWSNGSVTDVNGNVTTISGMTDVRVRGVARLRGDNLLLTVGAAIPTGKTAFDAADGSAAAVLAAPALRFRTPVLGSGAGATTGLVYAHEAGSWVLGVAGSVEMRGSYTATAQVGQPTTGLRPGHAGHFSVAADHLSGESRSSVTFLADVYTAGEVDQGAGATTQFQLGPTYTLSYQRMLGRSDMQSSFYVLERYRTPYSRGGVLVNGSERSETEAGMLAAVPTTPWLTLKLGVDGRVHTRSVPDGLPSDDPVRFAGAGIIGAGLQAGAQFRMMQGVYVLEPFVRANAARLDGGTQTAMASGAAAGLNFTARF